MVAKKEKKKIKAAVKKAEEAYLGGNYTQALKQFKALDEETRADQGVQYYTAISHFHLGDLKAAAVEFHRVIDQDKDGFYMLQAHMLLGYIYTVRAEYSRAEDHLYELLRKNYENAQIYSILGYIYNKRKDYTQAEYYYKKSLSLEPGNPNSHNGIGYNYLEWNKELDKAFDHIKKAVEYDHDNHAYLDSLGWLYYIKKSFSKALFYLTKSFRLKKHKVTEYHLKKVRQAGDGTK